MGRRKCWFGWVKKLFVSVYKTDSEKKARRCRWFCGRFKIKQYPVIATSQRTLIKAKEEQKHHALSVAMATAAAAEAAVAAAKAAAEVVRLTADSRSYNHLPKVDKNLAATNIQTAFRAYLARKALRALKALVRLQALIRGQLVRRKKLAKIKYLPWRTTGFEVHERNNPTAEESCKNDEMKQLIIKTRKDARDMKPAHDGHRKWDSSITSKEDAEAIRLNKHEATIKRERMKQYSFSLRERRHTHFSEEPIFTNEFGRHNCQLEEWPSKFAFCGKYRECVNQKVASDTASAEAYGTTQFRLINLQNQELGLNLPSSFPRRSFSSTTQISAAEDHLMPNSPHFSSHRFAGDSATERSRTMSVPTRRMKPSDDYLRRCSSCKSGLSYWSPYDRGTRMMELSSSINHKF